MQVLYLRCIGRPPIVSTRMVCCVFLMCYTCFFFFCFFTVAVLYPTRCVATQVRGRTSTHCYLCILVRWLAATHHKRKRIYTLINGGETHLATPMLFSAGFRVF